MIGFGCLIDYVDVCIVVLLEYYVIVVWFDDVLFLLVGICLWVIFNYVCLIINFVDDVVVVCDVILIDCWKVVVCGKNY